MGTTKMKYWRGLERVREDEQEEEEEDEDEGGETIHNTFTTPEQRKKDKLVKKRPRAAVMRAIITPEKDRRSGYELEDEVLGIGINPTGNRGLDKEMQIIRNEGIKRKPKQRKLGEDFVFLN